MPLLRLEGTIDAHGLAGRTCALPSGLLQETRRRMERLLERARAPRPAESGIGRPARVRRDRLERSTPRLSAGRLRGPRRDRGARALRACRARWRGLPRPRRDLRGGAAARAASTASPGTDRAPKREGEYTCARRPDAPGGPGGALPASESGRSALRREPRKADRWGGSDEIGGSPRASGTGLDLARIVEVCRQAHQRVSLWARLRRVGWAALGSIGALAIALAAIPAAGGLERELGGLSRAQPLWFGLTLGLFCACFLGLVGRRNPGIYGFRRPVGRDAWWFLLPAAIGAVAGGVWIPATALPGTGPPGIAWLALLAFPLLPIAAEILFRGLVHGVLAWTFSIQRAAGPWFVSWPALVSAGLYAPWGVVLASASLTVHPASAAAWNAPVLGSAVFGVACAMAREQSESLVLPVFFHVLCVPLGLLRSAAPRMSAAGDRASFSTDATAEWRVWDRAVLRSASGRRDVVIAGIPRSGSTLACHLLNRFPDTVDPARALLALRVPALAGSSRRERARAARSRGLLRGRESVAARARRGDLEARGWRDPGQPDRGGRAGRRFAAHARAARPAAPRRRAGLAAGSRRREGSCAWESRCRTTPALREAPLDLHRPAPAPGGALPLFATVRNPVAVLGSWNSVEFAVSDGRSRAAERLDPLRRLSSTLASNT